MPTPIPGCFTRFAFLKRVGSIAATGSFFVAVIFLFVALWSPSSVASPSPGQDVQASLLLSMDRPQPPSAKVSVLPLAPEEKEEADSFSPDLSTELNGWTPTALEWWMFISPPFAQPWQMSSPNYFYFVQIRAEYQAVSIAQGFRANFVRMQEFNYQQQHASPHH